MKFEADPLILIGPVYESNPIIAADPVLDMVLSYHLMKATLFQNIFIPDDISGGTVLNKGGKLLYQACSERICLPPKTELFSLQIPLGTGTVRTEYKIPQFAVDSPPEEVSEIEDALKEGFWGFIGLAVIAGLLALLTPCVFPMIPVTGAFFTKQSEAGS